MDENIYIHSLSSDDLFYNSKHALKLLNKILKSNALLSAELRNENTYNFCGNKYISLCDYEKRDLGKKYKSFNKECLYNGFNEFVKGGSGIIFPKNEFDVITPIILPKRIDQYKYYRNLMYDLGMSDIERYSDLVDEVQVKDKLSLDYMIGITLPVSSIINYFLSIDKNINNVLKERDKYRELLDNYDKDVDIYDIDALLPLDDDNVKNIVRTLKKK